MSRNIKNMNLLKKNNIIVYILILIIITLASCGNYKNNRLPEGTIDNSEYTYPPEKE